MSRWRRAGKVAAVLVPSSVCGAALTYRSRHRPDLPPHTLLDLQGRCVVLTGGTSGIGRATAEALVARGAHVLAGVRDQGRGERLRSDLADVGRDSSGRIDILPLDLANPASVQAFAEEASRKAAPRGVHAVVAAAAEIRYTLDRTDSGVEVTFASNQLGPQQLLTCLAPELTKAASAERHARVVIVGSRLERQGKLETETLRTHGVAYEELLTKFDPMKNYGASKLANMHLALELHRRLEPSHVDVIVVSPGMVHTNLWSQFPAWYRAMTYPVRALALRSSADAASGVMYALAAQEAEGLGGSYLYDGRPLERSSVAADAHLATEVFDACAARIVGVSSAA